MPSIEQNEKSIFNAVRKLESADARTEYLQQVSRDAPDVAERVKALLQAFEEKQSFLEAPVLQDEGETNTTVPTESAGTWIGRYKLREPIGQGGMGVVYVAEQDEPVRRKVALKLIKPGRDTKEVIARFQAERQALALMDHPNIARVLDAGTADSGRPYFVMELVRGVSITKYCDKVKLTTRERLQLFVTVCQAIQHAHQKGIIHRDIKPSNVLITQHDGRPVVKVIDFGLAKALHESFSNASVYTGFHQMLGTPKYMSPEQAEMSGLDVDTRSDIYSLGVLLYALLTGQTPIDSATDSKRSYDELRRQIREVTPPKPSARLSTIENAELSTIAEKRCVEPERLSRELRGDLDLIAMKALEKDRERRYETANAFAEDVSRFLNNEPVQAVSPSLFYLFSKMVHRHRAAITTACGFLALLVVATVVSSVLAVAANRQATIATVQAEKARKVTHELKQERDGANVLRAQAEAERDSARSEAYRNDIRGSYSNTHYADGSEQVRFDLTKWAPIAGESDERGWEWYLLNSMEFSAEQFLHGHTIYVRDVAASHNGKHLASLDSQGILVTWEVSTGRKIGSFQAHDAEGSALAWSPGGKRLAVGYADGVIVICDADNGGGSKQLSKHDKRITCLSFQPKTGLLVSSSEDKTAMVWDIETGQNVTTFAGHNGPIDSVNWHPSEPQVVSASADGQTVRFWSSETGDEVASPIKGHPIRWAIWHPDGQNLATVHRGYPRGMIWLHDGETHEPIQKRTVPGPVRAAWSRNGQYLATAHAHPYGMVQFWDPMATRSFRAFRGHTFGINHAEWIDSERVVTCSSDHTVRVWNFNRQDHRLFAEEDEPVKSIAWSPNSEYLASLSASFKTIRIFAANDGQQVREITDDEAIRDFAWGNNSRRLAAWAGSRIVVWDVPSDRKISEFDIGEEAADNPDDHSLAWNPGSNVLAVGRRGKTVLWDVSTARRIRDISPMAPEVRWSPDGRFLVATGMWAAHAIAMDLTDLQSDERRELSLNHGLSSPVAWHPDGSRLATGDETGVVRVHDAHSGKELVRMIGHARVQIASVAWHPGGQRIASCSELGEIKVWDAIRGHEILTFRQHSGCVNAVAYSSDGMRLASAGEDGQLIVWDATKGYARNQSDGLLDTLDQKDASGLATAHDLQLRAQIHANLGHWEKAAADFKRSAGLLGKDAPRWFDTAQSVIGPYPGNLQQAYPPEQQELIDVSKPLRGVAGGAATADDLRWQRAEPGLAQGSNLSMHIGSDQNVSAYATMRVYAPRQTNVTALVGAARFDAHRIWHNGELIYEDTQTRVAGRWPDEGNVAVTLKEGWNTFLIKVVNSPFREPEYYLYFRLSDDPTFLARAYERVDDPRRAIEAVNGFLIDHPDEPHLYFTRAVLNFRLGKREVAEQDLKRSTAALGHGVIRRLFQECQGDNRIETISAAIQLTPENIDLHAVRADWLTNEGRWEETLPDERALSSVPRYASRGGRLALLLAVMGKQDEYNQQRQVLLERIRKRSSASNEEAIACLAQPISPEELKQLDEGYEWRPLGLHGLTDPYSRAHYRVDGMIAYRRADYAKAAELLEKGAEYSATLNEEWMVEAARRRALASSAYLSMAKFRLGQVAEAKSILKKTRLDFEATDFDRWGADIKSEIALQEAEQLLSQ